MQARDKQVAEKTPRYLSIADSIRREIATLNVGQMLPPERDLARQHSTSHTTVRKVLGILEDEGLVKTYHGRGRVVTDPLSHGEFAIVMRPELMRTNSSLFYRETAMLLSRELQDYPDAEWSSRLHLCEPIEKFEVVNAMPDILGPETMKNLRGVFNFQPLAEPTRTFEQGGIPIVAIDTKTGFADARVTVTRDGLFDESTRHLFDVGCRTVGLLFGWEDEHSGTENTKRLFAEHAIEAGLSTKKEWMYDVHVGNSPERHGYECFMRLWEDGDCPEAFIINDDMVACGVFRAALHKRIHVPEQVRLISFANKGVDLHYHLPVTRFEFDPREVAASALEAMLSLLKGQQLDEKTRYVSGRFIKGETT